MSNDRIISYYGGKARLAEQLIDWMPKLENYIEAFAGGLSVFFKKPRARGLNIVNDLDKDIANLYYVCSRIDLFEQFKERASYLVQSKELYDIIRENIDKEKNNIIIPDVQRAIDYFFFITTSFNNRPGTNISKNINKWDTSLLEKVAWSRKKLDNVFVENLDVNVLIEKYHSKNNTMWFFDPPYYVANDTSYYGHVFKRYQHETFKDMIDLLNTNPTAKFMITYDNHPKIRELFKDYFLKEVGVNYSSTYETINTNELIITNYEIYDKQKSLF